MPDRTMNGGLITIVGRTRLPDGGMVSTVRVNLPDFGANGTITYGRFHNPTGDYETATFEPGGHIEVVEKYMTRAAARDGHKGWVALRRTLLWNSVLKGL